MIIMIYWYVMHPDMSLIVLLEDSENKLDQKNF